MNPFSLTGKTALIAGASRGIGQSIAEAIAHAGARTILAARSLPALANIARSLRAEGLQAEAVELDISARDSREKALEALPDIDILVNVAGINLRKRFIDYTPEEYDRILNTNLNGIFELTQGVGRRMIERNKGGKVVNIGSLTSVLGLPYLTVYTITKSALAGFSRALAAEWGHHNIQVNCIAPGFILTDLNREMWQRPEMQNWLAAVQPNQRMGAVEDIAPLAVFLSCPGSDYVTGQVIAVDGGFSTCSVWPFQPAP
ncbi:SDR family oxidoreductase [uncultured Paludibaculum sp.]|uniref:SDR family NAD(P)-dependent oxidoreductase n=1 Tax=uncultured Paludibaculum sp. TaxID=1765020 RepID=UPI002AAB51EA|nr:SDR family oxidoreductase [uncultured Paludibaculum sp.]